jgi:hypothetical protein
VAKKKSRAKPASKTQPPATPSYRDIIDEMRSEIEGFRDAMVEKYRNFHGRDLREDVSRYLQHVGIGIHGDMEQEKRLARNRLAAENLAK